MIFIIIAYDKTYFWFLINSLGLSVKVSKVSKKCKLSWKFVPYIYVKNLNLQS